MAIDKNVQLRCYCQQGYNTQGIQYIPAFAQQPRNQNIQVYIHSQHDSDMKYSRINKIDLLNVIGNGKGMDQVIIGDAPKQDML